MLKNLRAEMVRNGVSVTAMAAKIGKTDRCVRAKLGGATAWSLPEAQAVRDRFFPGMSLEYLFADSNSAQSAVRDSGTA